MSGPSENLLAAIGGVPAPATDVVVQAVDVHKFFGRLHVLKGVSMEVRRQETVVSYRRVRLGQDDLHSLCQSPRKDPDTGRIFVNGHLIGYREANGRLVEDRERNIARQRQEIGMVFQRFNLFPHMTALQNVTEAPTHVRGKRQG